MTRFKSLEEYKRQKFQDLEYHHQERLRDLDERSQRLIENENTRYLNERDDLERNASEKFQKLVDAMLEDGHLDSSEAVALVHQHNELQRKSRDALTKLLEKHGYGYFKQSMHNRTLSLPRVLEDVEPDPPPRPEPNIDYIQVNGPLRPGQKTIFILILAPAIFVILLKLLGVI